jgi:hypothetical protein
MKRPGRAIYLGEYLEFLLPRLRSSRKLPRWPPDVFALCSSLLLKAGAYCKTLGDWPPREPLKKPPGAWAEAVDKLGGDWRAAWVKDTELPIALNQCWKAATENWHLAISSIKDNAKLCQSLLQLCAAADQACAGVGSTYSLERPPDLQFHFQADDLLTPRQNGSSLCREVHPTRARVLPKMHTPWNGLTIRSLSLYLSLCTGDEVSPQWITLGSYPERESMNLLLVPWPFRIAPSQFDIAAPAKGEMKNMPDRFGFFGFRQRSDAGAVQIIQSLYTASKAEMGKIDGVVLPELALLEEEHEELRRFVLKEEAFLVTGVGRASQSAEEHDMNRVCFDIPHEAPLWQSKHHRWKLDESQLRQYSLGSRLSVEKRWWEHVSLNDRRLLFVSLPALVMSVLICEDLARPDPVGDLVRAVGPNLVIALLMDGPQLKGRWPERYAMALADDPGCSVLSLTCLGMSELSRPAQGPSRSRVIALWRDRTGTSTEIELPAGCGGIVISLSFQYEEEWTADGRRDYGEAVFPTLSGVRGIKGRPEWFEA